MLLVNVNNFLHFIMASEEDSGSVMDVLGNDLEHTMHLAVYCLSTSYSCGQ